MIRHVSKRYNLFIEEVICLSLYIGRGVAPYVEMELTFGPTSFDPLVRFCLRRPVACLSCLSFGESVCVVCDRAFGADYARRHSMSKNRND